MPSGVIRTTWSWPELDGLAGVLDERGDVAGEEVLALAAADHERRVAAGADHDVGGVGVDREQRERALQPPAHPPHRLGQLAAGVRVSRSPLGPDRGELAFEQVGRALGVGVAGELDAVGLELGPQLGEVLDDAVVDHGQPAAGRAVRVGVAVGRPAVGGPPGVADAGGAALDARQRVPSTPPRPAPLQVDELAGPLAGQQAPSPTTRHAGRVVAAVLQPPQPVQHDAQRRSGARVPHDSTHGRQPNRRSLNLRAREMPTFAQATDRSNQPTDRASRLRRRNWSPQAPDRRRDAVRECVAPEWPHDRRDPAVDPLVRADAAVRHDDLRGDVRPRHPDRLRSTSGRASPTPTARRRCSPRPPRRCAAGRNQYPPGPGHPGAAGRHRRPPAPVLGPRRTTPTARSWSRPAPPRRSRRAILALCEPGDEVVCFEPYYDSYAASIALAQARPAAGHPAPGRATGGTGSTRPTCARLLRADPAGAAQLAAQPDRQGVHPRRAEPDRRAVPAATTCSR